MGSMGSMGSSGSTDSQEPFAPDEPHEPKLIPNLLLFGRVLRAAGVHVHRERMVDAIRATGTSELNLPLFSLGERARIVTRRDAGAPRRLDVESPESDPAAAAAFA